MLGLKGDLGLRRSRIERQFFCTARLRRPVAANTLCGLCERQRWHRRSTVARLHVSDVEHLLNNLTQSVGVLRNHLRQLPEFGVRDIFIQQGVGLRNGGQRVANLMCHGGRHASHAGQLVSARAGLHLALILQKHDTKAFILRRMTGCHASAQTQAAQALPGVVNRDIAAAQVDLDEAAASQLIQLGPRGFGCQVKRCLALRSLGTQKLARRRVGRSDQAVGIDHQDPICQRLDHQLIDLPLHLNGALAQARALFFLCEPR